MFTTPNGGSRYRGVLTLLLAVVCAGISIAQERFGALTGVVTDSTGAAIPNATVTITNKGSGRAVTFQSGADGSYHARDIEPGHYKVVFEAKGFAKSEVADVNLLLGKTLKVDGQLNIGSMEQVVQVTEAAPLIDVGGVAIAHNITSEEFDRLPKARSFQGLVVTSPSVNTGEIEGGFQVNGASGAENQFVIDGISTNSLIDGRSRQNAVFEFLQEVQVKTGGIDAEYGGALGGVISAITKSGGNQFHGDAHYFFAGNAISAGPVKRLLLDPRNETTVSFVQDHKTQGDQHEVGGSLGGYLLKDKVWFFTSASPRWLRSSNDYLLDQGRNNITIDQKATIWQVFNKVSWDPHKRVRTNFQWLWTPTKVTGRLPAFDDYGNGITSDHISMEVNKQLGFFQPQSNYGGQVDWTLTNTSLVSIRGGRFWDDYKTSGVPQVSAVQYNNSAVGVPGVPAALQQAANYQNTPRVIQTGHDLTTRTYIQVDYSKYARFLGSHDVKVGWGTSKTVNNVDEFYPGGGYVLVNWNVPFRGDRGQYGYYEINDRGTRGSTGAHISNLYIQDKWKILPRLTLSLGLRTENEKVPSFRREIRDLAFEFPFADKIAPRLGASYDVFGTGKLKVYGSWGRFYDWVKYELSRGTFGGDFWRIRYRSLDTLDVFSLSGSNAPGRNLWAGGAFRDRRVPSFDAVAPGLKPMSTDLINVGVEYEVAPQTVFRGSYVRNNLRRTIEDLGALNAAGDEVYFYANPGEGVALVTPASGGTTKPIPTPKAVRTYDAMELTLTRRFSKGFFGSASYVFSRLYGNYAGIASSDEITTPTTGSSSQTSQQVAGSIARPGGSANRAWDLDNLLFDSKGNLDVLGRLPTDRPHVFKLYGSYTFKFGTEVGGFFYGGSGTPLSTYVVDLNQIPIFVNGRGDMGRTPFLTQTDLLIAHEVKMGEAKRLRFEFNTINLFNQKTARHTFNYLNRGAGRARSSAAIDLSTVDLFKGYDYNALIQQSGEGRGAYDPRYGSADLFNPGFQGRIAVKFIF